MAFTTTGGDLNLDDNAVVSAGPGAYASISSVASGKLNRLGVNGHVENVWSDGDVTLANNAIVYGSVTTTGIVTSQAGALIDGTKQEHASLDPLQTISWTVLFPAITQSPISVESAQTWAPGAYPDVDVKPTGSLSISTGTYTFQSLGVESNGTLNIDNSAGPVYLYMQNGFTFRGVINTTITKANVLFGVAGTNQVAIGSAFNGIIVAPNSTIDLAVVPTSHKGAMFAKSIWGHQGTSIQLAALQPSNFCKPTDPCSSFCPCSAGTQGCTSDASCGLGLVCGSGNGPAYGFPVGTNVCWPAACAATGGIGSQCSRVIQACQSNADCISGQSLWRCQRGPISIYSVADLLGSRLCN